jgi:PAS domain S-box-containing protein
MREMSGPTRLKTRKRKTPPRVDLPIPNSVDQAVIATDLTGKVVFWNLVAEKLYGWRWHEALGRPIDELVVPQGQQPESDRIMDQLRQGRSWTGRFRVRRRDGTEFTAEVTDQPMLDSNGIVVGIIGISRAEGT